MMNADKVIVNKIENSETKESSGGADRETIIISSKKRKYICERTLSRVISPTHAYVATIIVRVVVVMGY